MRFKISPAWDGTFRANITNVSPFEFEAVSADEYDALNRQLDALKDEIEAACASACNYCYENPNNVRRGLNGTTIRWTHPPDGLYCFASHIRERRFQREQKSQVE